jgi:hypothetical protein
MLCGILAAIALTAYAEAKDAEQKLQDNGYLRIVSTGKCYEGKNSDIEFICVTVKFLKYAKALRTRPNRNDWLEAQFAFSGPPVKGPKEPEFSSDYHFKVCHTTMSFGIELTNCQYIPAEDREEVVPGEKGKVVFPSSPDEKWVVWVPE